MSIISDFPEITLSRMAGMWFSGSKWYPVTPGY